jgi:hypothetical protein
MVAPANWLKSIIGKLVIVLMYLAPIAELREIVWRESLFALVLFRRGVS